MAGQQRWLQLGEQKNIQNYPNWQENWPENVQELFQITRNGKNIGRKSFRNCDSSPEMARKLDVDLFAEILTPPPIVGSQKFSSKWKRI